MAKDIPKEYETLRDYRYVASRYENEDRSSKVSWTIHKVLSGQEDRLELIQERKWTVRDARA